KGASPLLLMYSLTLNLDPAAPVCVLKPVRQSLSAVFMSLMNFWSRYSCGSAAATTGSKSLVSKSGVTRVAWSNALATLEAPFFAASTSSGVTGGGSSSNGSSPSSASSPSSFSSPASDSSSVSSSSSPSSPLLFPSGSWPSASSSSAVSSSSDSLSSLSVPLGFCSSSSASWSSASSSLPVFLPDSVCFSSASLAASSLS